MPSTASIVVDIKAQITGYQEQIEKIKSELKKVDPGSTIGKSLNATLAKAEQKLAQLTRNAEKRVTSQNQLNSLFDQLHGVGDLLRNLGRGMSNVGLNDVLETATDRARELGQQLRTVQQDMSKSGATFFDDLKKTNPKELQAVFDQLKFDPKTMGIDAFIEKFHQATEEAKAEVTDLKDKQKEAQSELERTTRMKTTRDQLPVALQGTNIAKGAVRDFLGAKSNSDVAKVASDRDAAAQEFINKIRTELENDTKRSDENKARLSGELTTTLTKLQEAKTQDEIQKILTELDKSLKSTAGEGHGGSYRGIAGMSKETLNSELVSKLSQTTYSADQGFIDQLKQVAQLLQDSSNKEANTQGAYLQQLINQIANPADLNTFNNNINAIVSTLQLGFQKVNKAGEDFNINVKQTGVKEITDALGAAETRAKQLETVSNSQAYNNLMQEYQSLNNRLQQIETALGLEKNNNKAGAAGDVNTVGKNVLNSVSGLNNNATESLKQYSSMLEDVQARQQMVGKVEGIAQRWFSVYAVVRMVSKAFRSMTENIKNLDKTITEIAIVTDMSQNDLWKQMPDYTKVARKYGASLQGVYEVSQLYYQQGLGQEDVMALTEETLKMARISGLDYSEATNYMTNAVRSFKIEMQDASRVVDVYSALAATSASSTSELATAMSKTASSAAAVGSSFEATSAMMAVMIETTRESPENIGSALKSIISRYGELKENKTGIDEEGEEYSLNKVDTALQSVGISIHNAKGEFRDFDDVIMELADSWDTIDTNTQRYIATVMAGNRQQSRFLALVSNGERLREETDIAENSEDAATMQMLKTMDSIDYKSQQLQTSLQSLYTSTGVENLFKGILDIGNQVVKTFTDMPTIFQLPIPAIISFGTSFITTANLVMTALRVLRAKFVAQWKQDETELTVHQANESAQRKEIDTQENETRTNNKELSSQRQTGIGKLTKTSKIGLGLGAAGLAMSTAAGMLSDKSRDNMRGLKGTLGVLGSTAQMAGIGLQIGGGWGALIGGTAGLLSGLMSNVQYFWESTADRAKRLKEEADEIESSYKQKTATVNNLDKEINKYKELSKTQYDSAEAREKFIEAANQLGSDMPELIDHYDSEGNAVLDLSNAYELLAAKRRDAIEAAHESADASIEAARTATKDKEEALDKIIEVTFTDGLVYENFNESREKTWSHIEDLAQNAQYPSGGIITPYENLVNIRKVNGGLDSLAQVALDVGISSENTPAITKMLSQLTSEEGRSELGMSLKSAPERAKVLSTWNNELSNITDEFSKELITFIMDSMMGGVTGITKAYGELLGAQASEESITRSKVAEYVNNYRLQQSDIANYSTDDTLVREAQKNLDLFNELSNTSEIMTTFITQRFIDSGKTWEEFKDDTENGLEQARTESMETLLKVNPASYEEINNLFKERDRYTLSQLKTKLHEIVKNTDIEDEIINSQTNYYKRLLKPDEFVEAIENRNKENEIDFNIRDFHKGSQLSGKELQSILAVNDKINSMYEHGSITKIAGQALLDQYTQLWAYSNETEQGILSNITDFSNLNELLDMIDNSEGIEDKEKFKEKITTLFQSFPQNLNTAIESYLNSYAESTENLSKDLSKVTSGMTQKDAQELASRLNIDTSTKYFTAKEGKLFLNDVNLLREYYFGENSELTNLKLQAEQQKEELLKVASPNAAFEEGRQFTYVSADELSSLSKAWDKWKETEKNENWEEFLGNYYTKRIDQAQELSQNLMSSMLLESAIKDGKVEDIVKAGTKENKFVEGYVAQVWEALKIGDFTWVNINEDYSNEFKSKLPELKKNYNDAQSSVIDSLINSLDEDFTIIEGSDFNQELLKSLDGKLVQLMPAVNGISNAVVTASRESILAFLEANEKGLPGMKKEDIREKIASMHKEDYEKSTDGALQAVLDNYDNIDEVTYKNFIDRFEIDENDVSKLFTKRADGTRKTNLPELVKSLNQEQIFNQLDDVTKEQLKEITTKAIDDGMASITNAASYVTKGTTKYSDMQDFVKLFNEAVPAAQATMQQLFTYDEDVQGYVLNNNKYTKYLQNEANILAALGENTTYINGLIDSANQSIIDAIDIKSFLGAENQNGQANKIFRKQLRNAGIEAKNRNKIVKSLMDGGEEAVAVMKAIADQQGVELSASDIESAYRNQVSRIEDAFEQITFGPGGLISGKAVEILEALEAEGKANITKLGDGSSAVINSITDIAAAYEAYYNELVGSGEATLAALNEAKAKVLETKSGRAQEQAAIDALGDASGMTYTTFGAILSEAGIKMTDDIVDAFTESVGGNKMRIKDFQAFADWMQWDFNSEEYISAFKSYNDGLIELNRKTEKAITEEILQLEDAKPGDLLNLTELNQYFSSRDSDGVIQTTINGLQTSLQRYGAYLQDGLLHLEDNANLLGIAQSLQSAAEHSGLDLQDGLQEIADMVQNILKSYAEAISNGITGGLSSVEAADLRSKARDLGVGEISFTETVEGLKLSERSAIALYTALKKVDSLQASIVFNKLNESLKESNDNFSSTTALMAHIKKINNEIYQADSIISNARKQQYQEELEIAKEILAVRSTQEDASFNFMSNKIPAAQNNPLNYAKNLTQAFQAFRDAFDISQVKKSGEGGLNKRAGFMNYEDWYNIVTEFNNMATKDAPIILSDAIKLDGTLESASKAIQAGAESLTSVDTGELKVDLMSIGIGIKSGADVLSSGVTDGVKEVADAQVKALDGLIAMLELVVAMEQLGDIDVDQNGIDFNDFFYFDKENNTFDTTQFSEAYNNFIQSMRDQLKLKEGDQGFNKDLQAALKGMKIGKISLADIVQWEPGELNSQTASFKTAYTAFVKSMVAAAQSGDYNLDNIAQSVQQELAKAGVFDEAITIDIGNTTLLFSGSSHAAIQWDDKDVEELVKKIGQDGKETLTTAMSKWVREETLAGKELTYVLALKRKIQLNDGGTVVSINFKGKDIDVTDMDETEKNSWLSAAALEEAGYDPKTIERQETAGTATTEIEYENETKMKVKSSTEGIQYESQDGNLYNTQDKALEADFKLYQADIEAGGDRLAKWGTKKYGTQAEYNWGERAIRATITPKVTLDTNGAEVNLSVSSELRDKVQDALLKKELKWSLDSTGNYKISVGGTTISLAAADVEVNGKPDLSKIIASIKTQFLGEDLGLQENITKGVQGALKDGIELKVSKETTEADIKEIQNAITNLKQEKPVDISVEQSANNNTNKIQQAIDNIKDGTAYVDVYERYHEADKSQSTIPKGNNNGIHGPTPYPIDGDTDATGTIGLAKSKGTLMGELGPELVVSQGRYFVAGQNGPEMVDLADDAIVFNHLQTKSLLEKGVSSGRGHAITNEQKAISYATGNVNGGPAKASASAALAALKQLRAQWAALGSLSAKDLAGKGGGGGGGGGGDPKAFIKDLEKWYDWLQHIAQLEKEITLEEAKRAKFQSDFTRQGSNYYNSQISSLEKLNDELATQMSLNASQEEYFEQRKKELNEQSAFSALYGFSETGQLYYKDVYRDNKSAFEWLSDLAGRNETTGEANYTAKEQYERLAAAGFAEFMKFDSSGNVIKQEGEDWYNTAVQAFWDKIDADKEEMQSLHDSIEDGKKTIVDLGKTQNEILHEIEDNQIEVENKILSTIEEMRQREIDEFSKQKDAIEKANNDLLDGLNSALEKEKNMYQTSQDESELNKLQRQLAILQRSGGSASEIRNLQDEINAKNQDIYFEKQQQQIDAIQEASDKEIEKLSAQLDVMTETLEYQKAHGMLWQQVYDILNKSPEEIITFIQDNTEEYWGKSNQELSKIMLQDFFKVDQLKAFQASVTGGMDVLVAQFGDDEAKKKLAEEKKQAVAAAEAAAAQQNAANSGLDNGASQTPTQSTTQSSNTPKNYTYNGQTYSSYTEAKNAKESEVRTLENSAASADKAGQNDTARALRASALAHRAFPIIPHYSAGGMNYTSGLAMLHGTQQEPEAVLNAKQTEILRHNILSNRPDSLISLLKSYNEVYSNIDHTIDTIPVTNDNSTTIEHAEVNMKVERLANNYDAAEAADNVMQAMVNIARKTKAQNRVGR